ncbi:NUDIX domain-containing protein [Actinomadura algeriensis]|uniref:8-oxo-dGTP pyrophosphatase MutT (NUDIX family) n=1 Tax=Actinomadura algeriensis TaxID=1679523 RepID=A0ABR9JMB0_9ACTN|nr:NUDIX hydrolase [Actinomadura algeriensis]MBE1531702.1 8-oxo-dGTP pyrophosphatase MutT (NUDIX family) [Actinomadura algeriensis]
MPYLPPRDWYATLPTAHVSAGALLTDDRDRVLLVKPNYRPYWQIPGGAMDAGEAPHRVAEREIREELGLPIEARRLLVVDVVPPNADMPRPMIHFTFDGGTVADPSAIRLEEDELDAFAFFTWADAEASLTPALGPRVPAARRARERGETVYLPAAP